MKKSTFYRRIKEVLMATNNKTDNSIITACKIAQPIADDRGIDVPEKRTFINRGVSRVKTPNIGKAPTDKTM